MKMAQNCDVGKCLGENITSKYFYLKSAVSRVDPLIFSHWYFFWFESVYTHNQKFVDSPFQAYVSTQAHGWRTARPPVLGGRGVSETWEGEVDERYVI